MTYYYKSLNLHHMWKGGFHCLGGNFAAASRIVGFNNLSSFKRKVFLSRPSPAVLSNKGYCSLSQVVSAIPQSNVLTSSKSENEAVHQDLVKREENAVEANNPSNGRVMLIDGTSVIYRAYFKLLAKVHHGHLTHADGNGDWVLTIFSALSFIIDVLGFMPSHAVVVFDHDEPDDWKLSCNVAVDWDSVMIFLCVGSSKHSKHMWSICTSYGVLDSETVVQCGVLIDQTFTFPFQEYRTENLVFHPTKLSWKKTKKLYLSARHVIVVVWAIHAFSQITFKGLNFRHTLYSLYKSNRPPTPDTVFQGLPYLKAAIKAMSVKVIEVPGVEADDVIGTLAVNSVKDGFKVRVVSPDKDFFQILSPSLRLLRIAPRGLEMVSFGMEDFAEKYGGLKPSQFVDVMALMGDKSDNIPGRLKLVSSLCLVSGMSNGNELKMFKPFSEMKQSARRVEGIGVVHAVELISRFGTLENLLKCVDQVEGESIRKALRQNAKQAVLSKELAKLRCELPEYMVPFATTDLIFKKPEDNGEKFTNLLTAVSSYAEGFSADMIIRRASKLWEKLEAR
ncbi:hypothetical protein POTOM_045729 [Populus tomentosa]|uniref:5'-3' exonuclease domain-containing protein n=1 Tax=Populus tomentosa TaxID=118781 RepID=A0A8X7YU62_POPTO|nr:hypothetical protein POTOM_045729 [Populus tomentosa]